jgi:hypothetical protein
VEDSTSSHGGSPDRVLGRPVQRIFREELDFLGAGLVDNDFLVTEEMAESTIQFRSVHGRRDRRRLLRGQLLQDLLALPFDASEFLLHTESQLQNHITENGAADRGCPATKLGIGFPEIEADGAGGFQGSGTPATGNGGRKVLSFLRVGENTNLYRKYSALPMGILGGPRLKELHCCSSRRLLLPLRLCMHTRSAHLYIDIVANP